MPSYVKVFVKAAVIYKMHSYLTVVGGEVEGAASSAGMGNSSHGGQEVQVFKMTTQSANNKAV